MMPNTENSNNVQKELAPFMGMGMQLAASVILCSAAGWWLDGKYGTEPWLMVITGFIGAIAGLTHFIRTALSMGKHKNVK